MRKKMIAMFLAGLMTVTALTGCGNSNSTSGDKTQTDSPTKDTEATKAPSTDGGEKVTLKWAIWDKDSVPYWTALKSDYEAKNKNVTIELVDLGSTDYMTVLATELSGSGSDFDLVTIKDVPGYATLVQKNTLVSLDDYIKKDNIDLKQYAGTTDQVTVNNSLYELPFRSDYWVMFYNKDIFDKAGVAYPTNDMTFDQYQKLAKSVTSTEFGSQVYGAHYHTWRSAVQLFGILDGKHTVLDGTYDFMKPYYEMVKQQEDDGVCRDYVTLSAEGLHYSAAFSTGDVAMMNMGTWFISTLMSKLDNGEYDKSLCGNWGIVKYPHAEGVQAGSTLATITGIGITEASKNKDAAWDFVKYISGEDGAKVLAATGNFPAIMTADIQDVIAKMSGFSSDSASKEALQFSNLYLEAPYHEKIAEINSVLDTYHKDIMMEECTIDEGIKKMNEEVGKLLK